MSVQVHLVEIHTNRLRLALLWMYSTPQPERPINKEIQMYQGKAPDKSRAVFALSHSIMLRPKVCENNSCSLCWG